MPVVWRVVFQKGTQLPNKPITVIAGFVCYYGTESSLPISTMIDLNLVKPKLADGMWLGERCVDEEQLAGFRRDLESIYAELACTKTAKKIIRTNNTQKNEALHGCQSRIYRKDVNHGNSIEYVFAMAAGILKLSLGECYLPTLAARFGCTLPASAFKYLDCKQAMLNKSATYKTSVAGKRKRAHSRIAPKKKYSLELVCMNLGQECICQAGKGC